MVKSTTVSRNINDVRGNIMGVSCVMLINAYDMIIFVLRYYSCLYQGTRGHLKYIPFITMVHVYLRTTTIEHSFTIVNLK